MNKSLSRSLFSKLNHHHHAYSPHRSFFASSTDHTTLLSNATVHKIQTNHNHDNDNSEHENNACNYILIPHGTDIDLALKVDKLHLARLSTQKQYIFGSKVVQRSLGSHKEVCASLLDVALEDIRKDYGGGAGGGGGDMVVPVGLASLEGLSKWVTHGIQTIDQDDDDDDDDDDASETSDHANAKPTLRRILDEDSSTYEAIKSIATGIPRPGHSVVGQGTYRDGEHGWTELALRYVKGNTGDNAGGEAELYQSKGGELVGIDHLADTSREGLMDAGGAMARFEFK